jgi:hypothetical protein
MNKLDETTVRIDAFFRRLDVMVDQAEYVDRSTLRKKYRLKLVNHGSYSEIVKV